MSLTAKNNDRMHCEVFQPVRHNFYKELALFPGPTELSVPLYSTGNNGKLGGAWERG